MACPNICSVQRLSGWQGFTSPDTAYLQNILVATHCDWQVDDDVELDEADLRVLARHRPAPSNQEVDLREGEGLAGSTEWGPSQAPWCAPGPWQANATSLILLHWLAGDLSICMSSTIRTTCNHICQRMPHPYCRTGALMWQTMVRVDAPPIMVRARRRASASNTVPSAAGSALDQDLAAIGVPAPRAAAGNGYHMPHLYQQTEHRPMADNSSDPDLPAGINIEEARYDSKRAWPEQDEMQHALSALHSRSLGYRPGSMRISTAACRDAAGREIGYMRSMLWMLL